MPLPAEIGHFLRDNFKSVWSLELLLLLEREPERSFAQVELVEALRASDAIVETGLAALIAAGLIVAERDDRVRYAPAAPALHELVVRVRQDYALRPDTVRRAIVSGSTGGASAFADAFRLRKG